MEQPVLFEIRGKTALITLNRPEKRNAISQELLVLLYNYLEQASADRAVRAIVLTGAGTTFCAGLDLSRLATDNLMNPRGDGSDLLSVLGACAKPVIGAVNGHAITGGFELALNCDFLIASTRASFADTHVKVGIHPGWGMSQLLQRAVGVRMARQLSLTCQFIPADKALAIGLVNEVVEPEQLIPRALEIGEQIGALGPEMSKTMKRLIDEGEALTLDRAMVLEKKGMLAFLEKTGALK